MVTALLAFAVALGILITFHELGHYLVARLCGVKVLTFSFGFGPKLFSKRLGRDKTEWCISALPLGGYVSMLDERQEGMVVDPAEAHRAFNRQSVYKRFAIVAAGPIANILLAIIFYAIMAWSGQPEIRPVMDTPVAQSQAAQLQIQRLDQVVSFGDKKIEGLEDFNWAILEHIGESNVPLVLDRGGTRFTVDFDLRDIKIDEDSTSPFAQLGINLWYGYPVLFNIQKGSPAALAGIKDGDVVLSADGRYGLSVQELVNYIKNRTRGRKLKDTDEEEVVLDEDVQEIAREVASGSHDGEAIVIKNLDKVYVDSNGHAFKAVNNVSLYVKKGEMFGVLGANGAGKSTLMAVITGRTNASSGEISILGHPIYTGDDAKEYVSICPQFDNHLFHGTARRQLNKQKVNSHNTKQS